tara:strand:- start:112 stop:672 length:561 start_codon:yes stop_codon:yes gene_type:complete
MLHSALITTILSGRDLLPLVVNLTVVMSFTFDATCEDDTDRLGETIGQAVDQGLLITLDGDLGAGKTRLTRAVVVGVGGSARHVSSPTFTLLQHYPGRLAIAHADAYRLNSSAEFLDLGPEEWLNVETVMLLEWSSRVPDALPTDRLAITIAVTGETARRFTLTPFGDVAEGVVQRVTAMMTSRPR